MRFYFAVSLVLAFIVSQSHADFSRGDLRKLCLELGLTPESITVLGMNAVDTQAAFDRLNDEETAITLFRQLQMDHQSLLNSLREARRTIRFVEDETDAITLQADIEAFEQQIESVSLQVETMSDQIRHFFLPAGLNTQLVTRVCEASGLALFVPAEFRVLPLIDDDYAEIYAALLAERHAYAEETMPDTDTQLTLGRYRNLPEVQAARSDLLYHLDAVKGEYYE